MQAIETHIRNERYFKEERVPLQWLKVCDKLAHDDRQAMSLTDFETISSGCVLPDDLGQLLKLLSEVGTVMYSTEEILKDIVVTNPVEFMIRAASKFVCDFPMHVVPEHAQAKLHVSEWQVSTCLCLKLFFFRGPSVFFLPVFLFEFLFTIQTDTPMSWHCALTICLNFLSSLHSN